MMTVSANKAIDVASTIFDLTSSLNMTGQPDLAEQEINHYSALIDKREPLMDELTVLMEKIKAGSAERQSVEKILRRVNDLDKEHKRVINHIRVHVTASMKDARSGKKLNTAYAHPMEREAFVHFDTKQ
jgi:uncharacterized protein YpuA (DUF1002 family)